MLCQLSYRGRQPPDCTRRFCSGSHDQGGRRATRREATLMRRFGVVGVALSLVLLGFLGFAGEAEAASGRVAALQIGLRAHGFDPGPVDGVRGPLTRRALLAFQRKKGLVCDGKLDREDAARARHARAAAARPASALGRGGRLGRRGARVPAPALRAPATGGRRALQPRDGCCAPPLPAPEPARPGRDRGAEHVSRPRPGRQAPRAGPRARRPAGRELLLDLRSLPREPVAPRAPEPALADDRHRPRPAPRAPRGRAADEPERDRAAREPRGRARRDRQLGARLRRRPDPRAGARVDGVRVPAGRRVERGRARRHAAAAGDVGVRRHGAPRLPHAEDVRRETCAPASATSAGSSTSSAATCGSRWRAGTRERARCGSAGLYRETKEFVRIVLALTAPSERYSACG